MNSWRRALVAGTAVLTFAAIAMLAAGPVGWRMGWLHYGVGLQRLIPIAGYLGLVAALAAAVTAVVELGYRRNAATGLVAVICLALASVAAYMPWQASGLRAAGFARMNDVSTDRADPPAFSAAVMAARKADGGSDSVYDPETAAIHAKAYGDIATVQTALPPGEAYKRALAAANAMPGWKIGAHDAEAGRMEASQASRWFGFVDDVVIRVKADGAGSRIDIRSASRHGRGDFGVNAKRVREFVAAVKGGL